MIAHADENDGLAGADGHTGSSHREAFGREERLQANDWRTRPVGFFPFFANLAETSRLVRTAEKFCQLGGQAVFFSHGGKYEELARDAGFAVQPVDPIYTEEQIDDLMKFDQLEKYGDPFPDDWLIDHVLNEEQAYVDHGVSLVVTGFNVPCVLSARKAHLPLVYIIPGTALPAYFKAGLATFPDTFENLVTRLLPKRLKDRMTNWIMLHSRVGTGAFNRVARRFVLPPLPNTLSLWMGDYTLASDVREALDLPAEYDLPEEDYTGPLLANLGIPLEEEVRAHLERPGRSIYFAMGSSGNKEIYLRALGALARSGCNVVAAYTTILSEEELPHFERNVLLKKFVPAEIVNKMADIAVLHGGQGTFYTAAYSGRPVVGIPMQFEQQYNIDILVRNGSAIRLSRRHFREEDLLRAVERILADYETYRDRAETLAQRLPAVDGALRGAQRIRAIAIERLRASASRTLRTGGTEPNPPRTPYFTFALKSLPSFFTIAAPS